MAETKLWPNSLPETPLVANYTETGYGAKVTFEPDVGLPIERRVGTVRMTEMSVTYSMTLEQVETFSDFFYDDLQQGALELQIMHPRKGTAVKAKIVGDEAFQSRYNAPGYYLVSFLLLVME